MYNLIYVNLYFMEAFPQCFIYTSISFNHFACLAHNHSPITFQDGATPLFLASQEGHVTIVRQLLSSGAKVNQPREVRGSILHPLFSTLCIQLVLVLFQWYDMIVCACMLYFVILIMHLVWFICCSIFTSHLRMAPHPCG